MALPTLSVGTAQENKQYVSILMTRVLFLTKDVHVCVGVMIEEVREVGTSPGRVWGWRTSD